MTAAFEDNSYQITKYPFDRSLIDQLNKNDWAKDMWPTVYLISNDREGEIYVGETTDAISRMNNHLSSPKRANLKDLRLITCEFFNKSATLDIESNLIKYIAADGKYRLQNGNAGLARHRYFQKPEYTRLFYQIWEGLRRENIAKQSLEKIDNSDLFKYSPYKSLNRDQLHSVLEICKSLLRDKADTILVQGGAGTGKTVLAIYFFKLMHSDIDFETLEDLTDEDAELYAALAKLKRKWPNPRMALVVPMASLRATLQRAFNNVKGLNASMVVGPMEITRAKYDIVLVDEAHRLRRRKNLGAVFGAFDQANERLGLDKEAHELDWVMLQSTKRILFYDPMQSIKPTDVRREDFESLSKKKDTLRLELKSQLRVKGGNDYMEFVSGLMSGKLTRDINNHDIRDYDFRLFTDIREFIDAVRQREKETGLSRFAAGYAWPWKSKNDKSAFDIEIDDVRMQWNGTTTDWINSPTAAEEVGCIHTTQGYDLNYAGIILGPEISYDHKTGEIVIKRENYHDRNGNVGISDPLELKSYIINIYQTLLLRAIRGTYVYVCDSDLREYFKKFVPTSELKATTKSLDHYGGLRLLKGGALKPYENAIPVFDIKVAAGDFSKSQLAESAVWAEFEKPHKDLFICQVIGESMNKRIPSGSWCLFRLSPHGSRQGKIVLVQHHSIQDPDLGGQYTIKRYESEKSVTEDDSWAHTSVILKPESTEQRYQPIRLSPDQEGSLQVIAEFVRIVC
ncbi:MAG TPA: DUF2075 domain-containing protein [Turneriella sp.]|nr:DUF2075 domain-containing protein [Turneriella sp.]